MQDRKRSAQEGEFTSWNQDFSWYSALHECEEKPKFKEDYFKGVDDAKEKKAEPKKETARRTTTSSDGVTIIDERQPTEKTASKEKKIFDDSEGEYVEFEEV